MFTIGQFSKICNISSKALRHYEKIGLLLPARVDEGNQYRYYSREQIDLVQTILFLKDIDISLKTIHRIIKGISDKEMENILAEHREKLIQTVSDCNTKIFRLNHWKQFQEARYMEKKEYCIGLQVIPEVHARAIRKVSANFPADIHPLYMTIMREMEENKIIPAGAPMIVYYDEEFNPERVDFEAAWPVSDKSFANKVYPECLAVCCVHVGPYDQICQAYEAVFTWINKNGYQAVGQMRDVYPNDPSITPPAELVTQVIVPVQKV